MSAGVGAPAPLRRREDVMGLPVTIDVRDEGIPVAAVDAAFAWLRWVDATFSTYRDDSEIARLNRGDARGGGRRRRRCARCCAPAAPCATGPRARSTRRRRRGCPESATGRARAAAGRERSSPRAT